MIAKSRFKICDENFVYNYMTLTLIIFNVNEYENNFWWKITSLLFTALIPHDLNIQILSISYTITVWKINSFLYAKKWYMIIFNKSTFNAFYMLQITIFSFIQENIWVKMLQFLSTIVHSIMLLWLSNFYLKFIEQEESCM